MRATLVAFCLVACTPPLPPADGTERLLLQTDAIREAAIAKATTGYTATGGASSTPLVALGTPIGVEGGRCYVVVERFRTDDLSGDARSHGIDFSVNLNAPTLKTQSDTVATESINPDFRGEHAGVVVGQGAIADAGCVDSRVELIPSFVIHYAPTKDRTVSSGTATLQIFSRAATPDELSGAAGQRERQRERGESVGIGHCNRCKSEYTACVGAGDPEATCSRAFYACAGSDRDACPAP